MPTHWAFYFQGSGLPLSVSWSCSCFICRAQIALLDLKVIAMMLHRMAFHLSDKVVALHLDNSTTKGYLCNQGSIVSPFLSRLACWQAQYYSHSSIFSFPSQCGGQLSVLGLVASGVATPPSDGSSSFHLWDLADVDLLGSSHTTQCQHYYTLEMPLPLGALELNAFNHPLMFQVSYVFPSPALVPLVLSKWLAEHVKGQLRLLILVAPCWMEALCNPSSQHVGRCSSVLCHHKKISLLMFQ